MTTTTEIAFNASLLETHVVTIDEGPAKLTIANPHLAQAVVNHLVDQGIIPTITTKGAFFKKWVLDFTVPVGHDLSLTINK